AVPVAEVVQVVGRVGQQRPVLARAYRDGHRPAAGHLDGLLLPAVERPPRVADLVPVAVEAFQVQVGDVRPEVGETPRDVVVVPDDHAGYAGERIAGHVQPAGAVQAHLVPDARHRRGQVRAVGEDRPAGRGARTGQHPG